MDDKIDLALRKILKECRAMSPEELDRNIKVALATPIGSMLKKFNDETLEAMQLIEKETK